MRCLSQAIFIQLNADRLCKRRSALGLTTKPTSKYYTSKKDDFVLRFLLVYVVKRLLTFVWFAAGSQARRHT